jgi:gluconate 5-dehydrogenase
MNQFSLNGKNALITGTRYGIGFAIVTSLADVGDEIFFNNISQELVDKGIAAYKKRH